MDRNTCNRYLGAILTTALEVEPGTTGESLYMLGCNIGLSDWSLLKAIMAQGELATFDGNEVRLTDKGRAMAIRIQQAAA